MNIQIGQELIAMCLVGNRASPIEHNSKNSPNHPCRGRTTKIGKIRASTTSSGADWSLPVITEQDIKDLNNNEAFKKVFVPLELAKVLYRQGFEANPSWRTEEFINDCVEKL